MYQQHELDAFAEFAMAVTSQPVDAHWEGVANKARLVNEQGQEVGDVRPTEDGSYNINIYPQYKSTPAPKVAPPPKPGGETPDGVVPTYSAKDNPDPNSSEMQEGPGMRELP